MSSTAKIQALVAEALEVGHLSEAQHEWILKEIHRDGTIDAEESALLSSLFQASQRGELTIGSKAARQQSSALDANKRDAIDRYAEQQERKSLGKAGEAELNDWGVLDSESTASQSATRSSLASAGSVSTLTSSPPQSTNTTPSFEEIFDHACQPRSTGPAFHPQNDRLLDVRLEGGLWIKTGTMVGYYGNITFTREGISEHGLKRLVKKAITGEGASLTKAIGSGNLYLADLGKKVSIIDLRGQSLTVNGPSILAFQDCIDWDITFLKQVAAMITGGFFQVRLWGMGLVAITTHFDPIVLKVSPAHPVMTDYHATVAWSSGVTPSLKTDISMQNLIGRGSGESLQLAFHGEGFVVIQPYEEIPVTE